MEKEIDFLRVPYRYPMCLNRECPKADTCLRQLTEQSVPADIKHWFIISPKHLTALKDACPHYRSSAKVRYAKGFIKILENLPYKQMQNIISRLTDYFNLRTYYRVRKGERLLSPFEQQKVLNILRNCGVSHPQEFDAYIEVYDW